MPVIDALIPWEVGTRSRDVFKSRAGGLQWTLLRLVAEDRLESLAKSGNVHRSLFRDWITEMKELIRRRLM